jgi:hypothetical protein
MDFAGAEFLARVKSAAAAPIANGQRPAIGDALAAAKPGVALKDMIDHFEDGKRFGRAEPLLLRVGARCTH